MREPEAYTHSDRLPLTPTLSKPGASLNFSSCGTRATAGLSGSGLRYNEKLSEAADGQPEPLAQRRGRRAAWLAWIFCAAVVLAAVLAVRAA
jgi:hypothetical protein